MLTEAPGSTGLARTDAGSFGGSTLPADGGGEQILRRLAEMQLEISAFRDECRATNEQLRTELLTQIQQLLTRMQFLHEGVMGRLRQLREPTTMTRRRPGR